MLDLAMSPIQQNEISYYQHTLQKPFTCVGRGLHTGFKTIMKVMPAPANNGYRFIRRDVTKGNNEILANWHTVSDTRLSTTVSNKNGVRACTIEHLLASLSASGIDNANIVIDSPEVPIMDGSAQPFLELIQSVGLQQLNAERKAIVIKKPIHVQDIEKTASLLPSFLPEIELTIDFASEVIGKQTMHTTINIDDFRKDIAAARTFGFVEQLTTLQELGFARGGSLHNAVLVGTSGVINETGLRFKDEFVRHKVLDCIGDLALAGGLIFGRCVTHRSGHNLNNQLLHELMSNKENYEYKTIRDIEKDWWKMHIENKSLHNKQQKNNTLRSIAGR